MLLNPPPPKPPVGRSLAHAVKAAWYWADTVGRVNPPAGTVPAGVVVDEPDPLPRRPPNSELAVLAGTPWLSKQAVYFANEAEAEPDGAVVVGEAVVAVLELPPHAASNAERASTGTTIMTQRTGQRLAERRWSTLSTEPRPPEGRRDNSE